MFNKLEAVILTVLSQLKADVQDYCDLETVDGGQSIVANDGSLASIVCFNGTKSVRTRCSGNPLPTSPRPSFGCQLANDSTSCCRTIGLTLPSNQR